MQDNDESNNRSRIKLRDGNLLTVFSDCSTVKQFKDKIHTMITPLGFSDFSFTVLNTPLTRCMTTLPDKVRQQYLKNNLLDKRCADPPSPTPTPRPLKLLTILAKDGLTIKEAADQLCISVDTANKHIAAAKQSLGATTLANAVYLAMVNNLLSGDLPVVQKG